MNDSKIEKLVYVSLRSSLIGVFLTLFVLLQDAPMRSLVDRITKRWKCNEIEVIIPSLPILSTW